MNSYSEGYNAFHAGTAFYANPWAEGGQDFHEWQEGWLAADVKCFGRLPLGGRITAATPRGETNDRAIPIDVAVARDWLVRMTPSGVRAKLAPTTCDGDHESCKGCMQAFSSTD